VTWGFETRIKDNGDRVFHGDFNLSSVGEMMAEIVGVVLALEITPYVEEVQHVSESTVGISVRTRFRKLSLIQIYAPQCGRPGQEVDQLYEMVQSSADFVI